MTENGESAAPVSAAELIIAEFEPPNPLVEDVLFPGVTLLAAKPKVGKSLLALNLAFGIASGLPVLGGRKARQGQVLYLMLEDTELGASNRLKAILSAYPGFQGWPQMMLHFYYRWPPMDQGGFDLLELWLTRNPETILIIVDTLKRVRPPQQRGLSIYEQDYEAIRWFKRLRDKYDCSFLVIHHANKMQSRFTEDPADVISGSTGLEGAAENIMIMRRSAAHDGVDLFIRGREVEEREWALQFEPLTMTWAIRGAAEEVSASDSRARILVAVKEAGEPCSPMDIADDTGLLVDNVRQLVRRMHRKGELARPKRGLYEVS